jgi:hypothetical protein
MFRLSQIAAPAVLGAALILGTGCAADRHEDIPITASEIGEAREGVFWTAPERGNVYVYDATSGDMVYTGKLERGQTVRVDPKNDRVMVDNNTVTERDLLNDHRYKVFFDKGERLGTDPTVSERTTITTDPNARTTVTTDPDKAVQSSERTTIETEGQKTTVTTDPKPEPDRTIIKKETTIEQKP